MQNLKSTGNTITLKYVKMPLEQTLNFDGLNAGVQLKVDRRFLDALPIIFGGWGYELTSGHTGNDFVSVAQNGKKYSVSSAFMDKSRTYRDPVNAICGLIVELAWARLRADPGLLCLHGAAVEMNGRLVVFPSTRKAGKSTLSVGLLAAGHKLFTDDFLPLQIGNHGQVFGLSHGISPRLRLPLPDQAGPALQTYIHERSYLTNDQYLYVQPNTGEMAEFGQSAPIGALVFLDQQAGAKQSLLPVDRSESLQALVKQNFSRAMNAAGILQTLAAIARGTQAFTLRYDNIDQAIKLLADQFDSWSKPPARLDDLDSRLFSTAPVAETQTATTVHPDELMVQASGVVAVHIDGDNFLAAPNGREIHYLNQGAASIWQMLAQAASHEQIVEILSVAYPDQPPERINTDVTATLGAFTASGVISPLPRVGGSGEKLKPACSAGMDGPG